MSIVRITLLPITSHLPSRRNRFFRDDLEIVEVGVTERSVLIALQQSKGAVEVHQVAVKVERGKPAGLVGPVGPVGRDEGVLRLQGRDRLAPRSPDRLLKRHRALGRQRQWDRQQQT